jgi:phosphoenolpyruvate phosphomutase
MNTSAEIFEFTDEWKGNIPLVAIPTNYPSVTLDELVSHEIKMVIYANQTLRAAHASMSRILKQMINSNSLSEVEEEMSSMEDIFVLQEMYRIKDKEKEIEAELKRLGYIN